MSRNTRNRILVASLLLFNRQGEPNTTTNDIADEVDISPGNLHYHFNKKADLVAALLAEFQADAARVLAPPDITHATLDDFWVFLHDLLECTAGYHFLFRDLEALTSEYPPVSRAMRHFARGLTAVFELHLRGLAKRGELRLSDADAARVSRNLAVIALFSERLDQLSGNSLTEDESALRVASSILQVLKPHATTAATEHMRELVSHYGA
jgi:AcrR family transcriptional regulator